MSKIIVVAALFVAVLAVAKQQAVFERAGIVHKCTAVSTPYGEDGAWHACEEGWLDGYPDLSIDSCDRAGRQGNREYWRCPVPLASSYQP